MVLISVLGQLQIGKYDTAMYITINFLISSITCPYGHGPLLYRCTASLRFVEVMLCITAIEGLSSWLAIDPLL